MFTNCLNARIESLARCRARQWSDFPGKPEQCDMQSLGAEIMTMAKADFLTKDTRSLPSFEARSRAECEKLGMKFPISTITLVHRSGEDIGD
jgi:hypothetical protein